MVSLPIRGEFLAPWKFVPHITKFEGNYAGITIELFDINRELRQNDSLSVRLDDNEIEVKYNIPRGAAGRSGLNTITYTPDEFFDSGWHHVQLEYRDNSGQHKHHWFEFEVPEFTVIDPQATVGSDLRGESGFLAYVTQISNGQGVGELHGNQWQNAEKQIRGEYINPQTEEPYINEANPEAFEGDGNDLLPSHSGYR